MIAASDFERRPMKPDVVPESARTQLGSLTEATCKARRFSKRLTHDRVGNNNECSICKTIGAQDGHDKGPLLGFSTSCVRPINRLGPQRKIRPGLHRDTDVFKQALSQMTLL